MELCYTGGQGYHGCIDRECHWSMKMVPIRLEITSHCSGVRWLVEVWRLVDLVPGGGESGTG